ncbi:DUF6134 family protein [Phenylobacterium parvum]|uniref:Tat pathway signal sequence domain protein n=1 Tax=Phenylobacterium parvum TaxID=2201350 RepID=A0A2Z3HT79_9CAUL|nr:DUF6134 family protein [Phenylobacterium parvum]AWM78452.1 hypothetical protein HYN04_12245 [Phenylobacterium parvum]
MTLTAPTRRTLLTAGALLAVPHPLLAATPSSRRLTFQVFRNGERIGEHRLSFSGDSASPTVSTEVDMTVRLGSVPVYRYRHTAREVWVDGRFESLETVTDATAGDRKVSARRTPSGVLIRTGRKEVLAPVGTSPLTHWNPNVLTGRLFNPQEGTLARITASPKGFRPITLADGRQVEGQVWALRGEAEIDNWYDRAGVWTGLKGRLEDGSRIEYRRV